MGLFDRGKDVNQGVGYDIAVLALRLTTGGLLAGHGAQKLFGAFNGPGLEGTAGWLESMGLKPGDKWALMASASEFGGGMLTALGLFHPIGPISTIGAMATAMRTAHAGKPIWVTEGGAELPVTNIAVAVALTLLGPGRLSLDRILGIDLPEAVSILTAGAVAAGVIAVESVANTQSGGDEETGEAVAA